MIAVHKIKYLIVVVLMVWLVILVKYLGHQKASREGLFLKVKNSINENVYPWHYDKHHSLHSKTIDHPLPTPTAPNSNEPKHEPLKLASPILRVAGGSEDNDLGEVMYKNKVLESEVTKPIISKGPQNDKQKKIVQSFLHAWRGYKTYAWGQDELKPISKMSNNWMYYGLTIVDSLDTLYIMGLQKEFKEARRWVKKDLNVVMSQTSVQFFEVVIRLLGGLLSAYHLSGDELFLNKAREFGTAMKECFHGPTPLPCHIINLGKGVAQFESTNLAEVGTIQLEFRDLGRSVNVSEFEDKAFGVSKYLHNLQTYDGLLPSLFIKDEHITQSLISMGGQSDSYYEYLLKQWIQTGRTIYWLQDDYVKAIAGAERHLMRRSAFKKMLYIGTMMNDDAKTFTPVMEHLACFLPGTLALGYMNGLSAEHLELAKDLMTTCYAMYEQTNLHLSPESINFIIEKQDSQFVVESERAYNIHRPETIESLFYLYRATRDPMYREWGWSIYAAFENHTKVASGYAGVENVDVRVSDISYIDKMETFYLAESLKYLFLLFDEADILPLDTWVFNTEAHPLPIHKN